MAWPVSVEPSKMSLIRIAEIARPSLEGLEKNPAATVTDVKHLASYDWIEASSATPTIAIPGCPPLWSPPKDPQQRIPKDSGLRYIAQDAARHPESPLESLFRSLYITNPSFDISSIDLVTGRNNIRELLSFVNPKLTGKNGTLAPFTIKVEVTKNNTALFCRDGAKTTQFVGPDEFVGYGHEFEKAYTTSEVDNSTGHHRIIAYRFGDLTIITRHETDGYVEKLLRSSEPEYKDDLPEILQPLPLSSSSSPSPKRLDYAASADSKLMMRNEGKVVPLESTLEIKTRVSHKPINIQEILPQLWVSQTPNLVRAYHSWGLFQGPEVEDVTLDVKRWEVTHQVDLKRLVVLLKRIINVDKESAGNVVIRYDDQIDKLVVWKETDGKRMLPDDLYSRLDGGKSGKRALDECPGEVKGLKTSKRRKL